MTLPPSDSGVTAEAAREPRRNEVLHHVTALIGEHGIDGMTMRPVAHATGLSTGTINYHFGNKRGLVLAALASAGEAPEGSVPGGSPLARLRRLLASFVHDSQERRAWWQFWVEVAAQSARDEELRRHERARQTAQRRHVDPGGAQEVCRIDRAGMRGIENDRGAPVGRLDDLEGRRQLTVKLGHRRASSLQPRSSVCPVWQKTGAL